MQFLEENKRKTADLMTHFFESRPGRVGLVRFLWQLLGPAYYWLESNEICEAIVGWPQKLPQKNEPARPGHPKLRYAGTVFWGQKVDFWKEKKNTHLLMGEFALAEW